MKTIRVGAEVHNVVTSSDGRWLFATSRGMNRLAVIDTASLAVSDEFDTGGSPNSVAASADRDAVYVARAGTDSIREFTLSSGAVRDIKVGRNAWSIEVSGDGTELYAALRDAGSIAKVDLDSGSVTSSVQLGAKPGSIRRTPDGDLLVATNAESDSVSVIDIASEAIVAEVGVGDNPHRARVSRDSQRAVTANHGDGTVSLIDLGSGTETAQIRVGGSPRAAEFTADGTEVLVVGDDSTLSVIDVSLGRVIDTITLDSPAVGISVHPDGTTAYLAHSDAGVVSVLRRS